MIKVKNKRESCINLFFYGETCIVFPIIKCEVMPFSPINIHFIIIIYMSVHCNGIRRKNYDMIQFFMLVFYHELVFFVMVFLRRGRRVFKEGKSFFK